MWWRRRLPKRGSLRARLGFEELIESPLPTQVGFGFLVKGKYTVLPGSPFSPGHARTLWNITPLSQAPKRTCERCPAAFSYSPASAPCTPGVVKGSQGHSVCGTDDLETPRAAGLETCLWMSGRSVLCCPLKATCCLSRAENGLFLDNQPLFTPS